ncbi:type II secretion system minor pseudopilin GspJ [Sphingopyxis sp. XHP0097]|uniref:Type II secretion system protein J n=1 Tax=Sphingopyxis jiangsuensis TaxID=2871171 RepID=A0ABS7MGV0_9SPHN|nr:MULTISPECIES: type II secretion system minor pseudopilin GspJ [Sphingopyxis]MBY4637971.1 type II secretion system minor pseudopilin GspJ [Sphingopyxis jiangsuensis]
MRRCFPWRRGAPASAGAHWPDGQRGLTLVEMLVALSLFAAIAAMGVGLLRSSVDTQDAVQERLKAMSGVNRLRAVMANDLAQAVQRSTRGASGEPVPAFIGSSTGFAFVHSGAANFDGISRPGVERVGYALSGSEWRRAAQPMLDGAMLGAGDPLLRDVASVRVRYRDALGNWGDGWTSEPGDRLPLALEVQLTRPGRAPLTMLFLTAPTPPPPPATVEEAP